MFFAAVRKYTFETCKFLMKENNKHTGINKTIYNGSHCNKLFEDHI